MPPQSRDVRVAQPRSKPLGAPAPGSDSGYEDLADAATGQAAKDLARELCAACDRQREQRQQMEATAAVAVADAAHAASASTSAAALAASYAALVSTIAEVVGILVPRARSAGGSMHRWVARAADHAGEQALLAIRAAEAAAVAARLAELTANDHELTLDEETRGSIPPFRNLL